MGARCVLASDAVSVSTGLEAVLPSHGSPAAGVESAAARGAPPASASHSARNKQSLAR